MNKRDDEVARAIGEALLQREIAVFNEHVSSGVMTVPALDGMGFGMAVPVSRETVMEYEKQNDDTKRCTVGVGMYRKAVQRATELRRIARNLSRFPELSTRNAALLKRARDAYTESRARFVQHLSECKECNDKYGDRVVKA